MRKLALAVALSCAVLTACTDAQVTKTNAVLDKYDHALDNFNAIVARIVRRPRIPARMLLA